MSHVRPPKPRKLFAHHRWTRDEEALLGSISDRALAWKLGRTIVAVAARRHLKHIRTTKTWRPEDDRVLGTRPDSQIARLLKRRPDNVRWRRLKLGIPCRYVHRPWKKTHLDLLGAIPDQEVALQTGHPLESVRAKRQELGRSKPDPIMDYWSPVEDKLLGTMDDDAVAK